MNPASEIQALVRAFVDETAALAKGEALRHAAEALGVHTPLTATRSPLENGKRSAAELGELKQRILEHSAAHFGLRTERINASLDTSTGSSRSASSSTRARSGPRASGEGCGTTRTEGRDESARGVRTRASYTAQPRIPAYVNAHRQLQVGEQALHHRLENVLIEHRILRDDEDLHSAISSQPVANSSSIPVRSSVSSKRGRSPRRRMIVPSCSATRPNTTAESSVARGTACSISGE